MAESKSRSLYKLLKYEPSGPAAKAAIVAYLRGMLGLPGRTEVGYEQIRVTFKVKSDAPKEKLEELIDLAQKRSPAANSVMNPVPVSISLETK